MTELNFDRLEYEVTHRLRGSLRSTEAERLLRDRCVNAVKLRSVDRAELFNGIKLTSVAHNSPVHMIQSAKVVDTLKSTGVMDLVCICINAQNTKEENK